MKITLLHPSRGRGEKAKATYDFWMQNSSGKIEIEHILSLDESDRQKGEYITLFLHGNSKIITHSNTCVVEATNEAAKVATGDILIYLSDDFKCPVNWDVKLVEIFSKVATPALVKVDDCLQKFHVGVLTIPIMNRALYERLGYFWHPAYRSMFVDEDLYWTVKNNGWMIEAPELKFEHEHWSNGKTTVDETYKKSEANWNQGKEVFRQRKAQNFPL